MFFCNLIFFFYVPTNILRTTDKFNFHQSHLWKAMVQYNIKYCFKILRNNNPPIFVSNSVVINASHSFSVLIYLIFHHFLCIQCILNLFILKLERFNTQQLNNCTYTDCLKKITIFIDIYTNIFTRYLI